MLTCSKPTGRHYIIIIEYYSDFYDVVRLTPTSSMAVIAAVKNVFACFDLPTVRYLR